MHYSSYHCQNVSSSCDLVMVNCWVIAIRDHFANASSAAPRMRTSALADRGFKLHRQSSGYLYIDIRIADICNSVSSSESECEHTYSKKVESLLTLGSMTMGFSSSSSGGEMSKTCRTMAMTRNISAWAKPFPGHVLKPRQGAPAVSRQSGQRISALLAV